ncbi:hypothetical protein ScPMuIL_003879 [Solemya velum]
MLKIEPENMSRDLNTDSDTMKRKLGSMLIVLFIIIMGQEASSETSCEPQSNSIEVECKAYVHRLADCEPTHLQGVYPDIYNRNVTFTPAEPYSFSGTPFMKTKSGDNIDYPGINLTFQAPADGSLSYLKGFELLINKYKQASAGSPESTMCVIFDLSNMTWSYNDYAMEFKRSIHPLQQNRFYVFELYSLPKPPFFHDKYLQLSFSTSQTPTRAALPKDWVTMISYQVICTSATADVIFSFAPPPMAFGFTEFDVSLVYSKTSTKKSARVTVFSHRFEDVGPGQYEIFINPYDEKPFDPEMCLCKGDSGECVRCIRSKTPHFNVTECISPNDVPESTPTRTFISTPSIGLAMTDDDDSTVKVVMTAVGSLIGSSLVLFLVILYCRLRRQKKEKYTRRKGAQNDTQPEKHHNATLEKKLLRRKTVHLVYFQDHVHHVKTVECLADYLQTYCFCDVLYAPWYLTDIMREGKNIWSLNSIQNADFTIIIHSEGSYRHYMARKENMAYEGREIGPLGDMFMPAIIYILNQCMGQLTYNKFIMTYFEYSKSAHIPSEMCPGLNYKLLKHFKELLCHIHGLTLGIDRLDEIDLPLTDNHSSTTKGRKLITACSVASHFERKNPNWFSEMYGVCSTEEERSLRQDSGIDTSMPNLSDSDKISMASDRWTIRKDDISWVPPSELCSRQISLHPGCFQTSETFCEKHGIVERPDDVEFYPPEKDITAAEVKSCTPSDCMEMVNKKYNQDMYTLGMECGLLSDYESVSLGGQSV